MQEERQFVEVENLNGEIQKVEIFAQIKSERDNKVYVIKGDEVERLFKMTNFNTEEAMVRFSNKLRKMGIDDELERMGIEEGDIVRILDYEFEYTR